MAGELIRVRGDRWCVGSTRQEVIPEVGKILDRAFQVVLAADQVADDLRWMGEHGFSPEQRARWGAASANMDGAYNICGAASPAIDAMIAALLAARTQEDFVAAVRALDRVLLSGFYVVPLFYARDQWIAYSAKFGRPEKTPLFGANTDAWWSKGP